ncbi:MAG: amidohydrolase family protein [Fimbriimonadaceae bacterium]|nr:amidohydrolase family protein [Fimbriimonadaceae bacterium]QYK58385.1 MAG: amidohydrolase family protein [Fimbriimonadaceae bacterium]
MSLRCLALGPLGWGRYRVDWTNGSPSLEPTDEPPEAIFTPGLVDRHIHGAFGIDFMTASQDELANLSLRLKDLGYESWLPTTVTASVESVLAAVANLPNDPAPCGFHLEGPFISPSYPGAQPPEWIISPDEASPAWDPIFDHPKLRVVTLAPETPGCLDLVRRLANRGVVVSLGHTDATAEQARAAIEAGASQTTHTFNAMRRFHHREPGVIEVALTDPRVECELIYDRRHVSKEAASLLLRAKGLEGVVGVSDSTAATGMPNGTELEMWGHLCRVQSGTVRIAETGALAGSTSTLLDCFQALADDFGPETAVRACSVNPRRVLGTHKPRVWCVFSLRHTLLETRGPVL